MSKILITGANRGIGLALTGEWLSRGHEVIAAARRPEQARELGQLKEEEAGRAGRLRVIQLDVCAPASVGQAYEEVKECWGSVDVLINNAAVFPEDGHESFVDLDVNHFEAAFATNVTGVARMIQVFLPLLKAGERPRILNISSGAGSITTKDNSKYYCYGASKAALNMFTRTVAHELLPQGVITVALSPGWVKTEMGGPNAEITPAESARAIVTTALELEDKDNGQFMGRDGNTRSYAW